jgi:hypothetical protein
MGEVIPTFPLSLRCTRTQHALEERFGTLRE